MTEHSLAMDMFQGMKTADDPIDASRPIKVICIGAGMSGIACGVRFPQRIRNLDLTIYDKNDDVGGVWLENIYPGVTCDVPSHSYQYSFANNPTWSHFFAPGPEIQSYLRKVAEKFGAMKYIRLKHLFKGAKWSEQLHKWEVTIFDMVDQKEFKDYADVLIKATGNLNKWDWPRFEGLHDFKGPVIHSACWDKSFDPTDKEVSVIGYGATAVQLVPSILPKVRSMDHYVRGKAWISPAGFVAADPRKTSTDVHNFEHTDDERKLWSDSPETYLQYRKQIEDFVNRAQLIHWKGSELNQTFSKATEESMKSRLAPKPEIWKHLRPDYPPLCRRVSPGPRYLEALVEDKLNFIPKGIRKITENGIVDTDGVFRQTDAIICATGFDTSFSAQDIPIIGKDGKSLADVWQSEPVAYMSICPPAMPNFFLFHGPNGGPGAGSSFPICEAAAEYIIKCIQKMQRENIKSMVVKDRAIATFMKQKDDYFSKTTFSYTCNNWAKRTPAGRVTGYWPGSAVHFRAATENPRWEDFDYELFDEENSLSWLGNGLTHAQQVNTSTTDYLTTVDIPPLANLPNGREERSNGVNNAAVRLL